MLSYSWCLIFVHVFPLTNGVDWIEHRGLWYYISEGDEVDYHQATQICKFMNAHLAVITNDDQNDFLKNKTKDGIERWVGLSNNRSHHKHKPCKNETLFWDRDWHCTNNYTAVDFTYTNLSDCSAVTTKLGIWNLKMCSDRTRYICQWECKQFYFIISLEEDKFNGLYLLDRYNNSYAQYRKKRTNRKIRMHKTDLYRWILTNEEESNHTLRAQLYTESYVPYGEGLSWKSSGDQLLTSSTSCTECKNLSMSIMEVSGEQSIFYNLFLNYSIPGYTNIENNVFLKQHDNSQSCICMPTIDECGTRCGYIFPYPTVTTSTTLSNGENVIITNQCVLQYNPTTTTEISDIETSTQRNSLSMSSKPTTSEILEESNGPENDLSASTTFSQDIASERQSSNLTTIVACVVFVAVLVIIVVVVVIILMLRKRRNRQNDTKSHVQSTGNVNHQLPNSNVYACDTFTVDTLQPTYAEINVDDNTHDVSNANNHYSYIGKADFNIESSNQNLGENAIYSKEKPITGYLAPDYGILMDDISNQRKQQSNQQTYDYEQPIYTQVVKTDTTKHECKLDEDFPRQEHDIPDSGNEMAPDIPPIGQEAINTATCECEYYNTGKQDDEEDDLELFENTVYN